MTATLSPPATGELLTREAAMDGWNGARMKQIRKARGLTQFDVARSLNIQPPVISRWESGQEPLYKNACILAAFFGVSLDAFQQSVDTAIPWLRGRKPPEGPRRR